MQPSFELDKYEIISCTYKRNEPEGDRQEGSVNFEYLAQRGEEDPSKFRVEIKTTLKGLADIELVIAGYFTSTGLLDESDIQEALLFSSLFLLIPFIRSYIHTISCQDGRPAVIVPVINVTHLLNSHLDDDEE
ncbi:MAG: hypothetical protein ACOX4A_02120 [Saccharofermentanales bacterium]|jgi:preprotein translocase subunit SecB